MAKRKKLNPRAVILLCVVGGAILIGGGLFAMKKTGLFNKLFPRDPKPHLEAADAAYNERNWQEAIRYYNKAIAAQQDHGDTDAETLYKRGMAALAHVTGSSDLTRAQATSYWQLGIASIEEAVAIDPEHLGARRKLADIRRTQSLLSRDSDLYIKEANKLLELLEDGPEKAQVYFYRGQARERQIPANRGYADDALADYEAAILLAPDNLDYWVGGKVRLLVYLGQEEERRYEEAEACILEAIAANPDQAQGYSEYANLLILRERRSDALEQINLAIDVEPDNPTGHMALGRYYVTEQHFEEALEAFETAEAIDPSSYQIYFYKAIVLRRLYRAEEATEAQQKCVDVLDQALSEDAIADMDGEELGELKKAQFGSLLALADGLLDGLSVVELTAEEREGRLENVRQIIERTNEIFDPKAPVAQRLKILGRLALLDGDRKYAVNLLRQAYDLYKENASFDPTVSRLLMDLYVGFQQWGEAERILKEYDRDPRLASPETAIAMAKIHRHYREFKQGIRPMDDVLADDPDNQAARSLRTDLYIRSGDLDRLPEGSEASTQLVVLLAVQAERKWLDGFREEATAMLEDLHRRVPDNLFVLQRLMMIYVKLDRIDEARALAQAALAGDPDNERLQQQAYILNLSTDAERLQARLAMAEDIEDPYQRALEKAQVYLLQDDPDQYFHWQQEAVAIAPDRVRSGAISQLLETALSHQKLDIVDQCLAWAKEQDLDGLGGRYYEAYVLSARGEFDGAISILEDIVRDDPLHLFAKLLLGQCHFNKGNWTDARHQFEAVYTADRGNAQAPVQMIRVCLATGDRDGWRMWVERAYEISPNDPFVRSNYLEVKADLSDPEILIEERERLAQQFPDDIVNLRPLAKLYEETGRLMDAERVHRDIIRVYPDKIYAVGLLINFYDRTDQTTKIDPIITGLLEMSQTPQEKIAVHVLHASFLAERMSKRALHILDQAIEIDPADPRPYEAKAGIFRFQEDFDEAIVMMEMFVERSEDPHEAKKSLVQYRLEAGQYDVAAREIDGLLAEAPDDLGSQLLLGVLAFQQGENAKALEIFEAILDVDANNTSALIQAARVYFFDGNIDKVKEYMLRASQESQNDEIGWELAKMYYESGDTSRALSALREIRGRSPAFEAATRTMARILLDTGNWAQLLELLQEARAQFPDKAEYWTIESSMWQERNDLARAATASGEALKLQPMDLAYLRDYLLLLLESGQTAKAQSVAENFSNKPHARALTKAIRARIVAPQDPQQAETLFDEAIVEAGGGEMGFVAWQYSVAFGDDRASEKVAQWCEDRPDNLVLRLMAGQFFRSAGNTEAALRYFDQALLLAGTDDQKVEVHGQIGQTYHEAEAYEQAEAAYQAALAIDPNNAVALNNLAYMYVADLDQPTEESLALAYRAVDQMPNNPSVLDTYGWTLAKLGRYEDAAIPLRQAERLGASPSIHYHLGWVMEKTQDPAEAHRYYQLSLGKLTEGEAPELYREVTEALQRVQE